MRLPPSQTNARTLFVRALELGRADILPHFTDRCGERGLTTVDAENLIRYGGYSDPRYDEDYIDWVYEITGKVDAKSWKIVVALDCGDDMWDAPRITFITAHRVGGKRKRER